MHKKTIILNDEHYFDDSEEYFLSESLKGNCEITAPGSKDSYTQPYWMWKIKRQDYRRSVDQLAKASGISVSKVTK